MQTDDIIMQILNDEDLLFTVIMGSLGALAIVFGCVTKMCTTASRERTKRDIAAYIAEGSVSPEQGERLIKSGRRC